jgi:hypothetical protein
MAEPDAIADVVLNALGRRHDLAGEIVLITAGGTREAKRPAVLNHPIGRSCFLRPRQHSPF